MPKQCEQRLTAYLSADVGYNRFTSEDEQGKHRALRSHLDLFAPDVECHRALLVHFAASGLVADHSTTIDTPGSDAQVSGDARNRHREPPDIPKLNLEVMQIPSAAYVTCDDLEDYDLTRHTGDVLEARTNRTNALN